MKGNATVLGNVEYVPTALENLLSVSAAVESGFTFSVNCAGETVQMRHKITTFQSDVVKVQGLYFVALRCWGNPKIPTVHLSHVCSEYDTS